MQKISPNYTGQWPLTPLSKYYCSDVLHLWHGLVFHPSWIAKSSDMLNPVLKCQIQCLGVKFGVDISNSVEMSNSVLICPFITSDNNNFPQRHRAVAINAIIKVLLLWRSAPVTWVGLCVKLDRSAWNRCYVMMKSSYGVLV